MSRMTTFPLSELFQKCEKHFHVWKWNICDPQRLKPYTKCIAFTLARTEFVFLFCLFVDFNSYLYFSEYVRNKNVLSGQISMQHICPHGRLKLRISYACAISNSNERSVNNRRKKQIIGSWKTSAFFCRKYLFLVNCV